MVILHLFLGAFATAGLFMIGKGWIQIRDAGESKHWPRVVATITQSHLERTQTQKGAAAYRPKITYRYAVDGQEYTGDTIYFGGSIMSPGSVRSQKLIDPYPVGQSVEIAHHPREINRSVIEPGVSKRTWGTFLFGLLFFSTSVQFWLLLWTQL